MINLELSREQKKLVQKTRELVQEEIKPRALELDKAGDSQFDWSLVKILAGYNLVCPTIPQEYGGLGLGHLAAALVIEEIAYGCAGAAAVVDANMHAASPIILGGNPEQKLKFLPLLTSAVPALAAFALTESGAGSDIDSISTQAVLRKKEYIINGRKDFILNASVASYFAVFAATDPRQKRASLRAFIVPSTAEGLKVGRVRNKSGIRYANTSEVILNNLAIPESYVVGGDRSGSGYLLMAQTFDRGRALVGATAVGIARSAYEMALDHAKTRKQFGKPLIENQTVAFALAEMATKIELSRLITWKACLLIDNDQDYTTASSMAKLFASEVAQEITCKAADIIGSHGYLADSFADKYVRDARVLSTIEGTNNIQKAIIASLL
ncbi:MAG: acyl-CoA dehydrogenase family protein [Ignavibacteriales bacterium]